MAIPRTDLLVDRVRRLTHEQSYTDSATLSSQRGVQTQTIVEYLNEGQRALHGAIYGTAREVFVKEGTIDVVSGTEAYDLPSDAFLGGGLVSVHYKYGSGSGEYRRLPQRVLSQRDTRSNGTPAYYIQKYDAILLNPIPQESTTNGLRLIYDYKLPDVDVRRGKVSAVDDGANPTSITVTNKDLLDVALTATNAPEYITVVDANGVQQMKAIPVSSYNSSTGVITLGSFTPGATEAVAVNDYVVIGADATTHSQYADFCENFIVAYAVYHILDWRGHPGAPAAAQRLLAASDMIIDTFSDYNADNLEIPEIDARRRLDLDGYI